LLSLIINCAFFFVELWVGVVSGSLALLSDAAHMFGDVGALALALFVGRLALLSARPTRTFGLRRAEVLGAFVNALLMVALVGGIVWEAVQRLGSEAQAMDSQPILIVGGAGLLINLVSAYWLARASKGDLNVQAALLHMLADALGSLGAMIAALFIYLGFPSADAWISILTAALVLWGSFELLRKSTRILLELPPTELDVCAIQRLVEANPEVASVHDLHVWSLGGGEAILTAHIRLKDEASASALQETLLGQLAQEFSIHHATLQFELESNLPCPGQDCGGQARALSA